MIYITRLNGVIYTEYNTNIYIYTFHAALSYYILYDTCIFHLYIDDGWQSTSSKLDSENTLETASTTKTITSTMTTNKSATTNKADNKDTMPGSKGNKVNSNSIGESHNSNSSSSSVIAITVTNEQVIHEVSENLTGTPISGSIAAEVGQNYDPFMFMYRLR